MSPHIRIKVPAHAAVYHVITRTNARQFRLDDHMKQFFIFTLKRLKKLFFVSYPSFTILENHYHLQVHVKDKEDVTEEEAINRWNTYHEVPYTKNEEVDEYRHYVRRVLCDISEFMKRLNQLVTREYNRHTNSIGTLWESRFRSTVIERGRAVAQCGAYIELNSFRASLVGRPEDYNYSSLNHLKHGNSDSLVSEDLLKESLDIVPKVSAAADPGEHTRQLYEAYRAFVYESGTTPHRGEHGIPEEGGLVVTEEIKKALSTCGAPPDRGSCVARVIDFCRAKLIGTSAYARRFYQDHINPGKTGKAQKDHKSRWIGGTGNHLHAVSSKAGHTIEKRIKEAETTGKRDNSRSSP